MKRKNIWIKYTAAALSLSLLASALALSGVSLPPRDWGETASRPFFRLLSPLLRRVDQGKEYLRDQQALREENRRLRDQAALLRREAAGASLARGENERLRALLALEAPGEALPEGGLLDAWVIARVPDNWQGKRTLDRGEAQGAAVGQWVVDANGSLVGRLTETGRNWSTLTLVVDRSFQTAGQGARSQVLGALEGDPAHMARGELAFTCLTPSDPVALGETVVTFSRPGGLVVGTVTSLEEDPGGLTRTAAVTPAADLERLGQVFILTAAGAGS